MTEWTCHQNGELLALPAIRGQKSALRTVGRMTTPTRQSHYEKYHESDISPTATQSCSSFCCDELVTIKATIQDHDPVVPHRERSKSWLLTLVILVSISLSFIFIFRLHHALPSCGFPAPSFSDATDQDPSDTTFPSTSPTFSSNGRTDQVQWDNYTLVLRGQRVLI